MPAAAADDVEEAVGRLGLERFVLVGHSGGGLVALQHAADHPERLAGLLLVDSSGDSREVPAEQMDPLLAALDSERRRPVHLPSLPARQLIGISAAVAQFGRGARYVRPVAGSAAPVAATTRLMLIA